MTARRFHRTTEAIPRRPWKAKSPFAVIPIKISIEKVTRGVRTRYNSVLLPLISIVQCPGRPLILGHTPSAAGTFRKKFRKNSGKTPETLSERFLEFPSRVRLGCPKPYNSRHLRLPERFQNSLPPSTAGDVSFFRIGSGEGLSELVMEFPAVLGVFLTYGSPTHCGGFTRLPGGSNLGYELQAKLV